MAKKPKSDRPRIKALTHPIRGRILSVLQAKGMASPKQLSDLLEEPLGNISYHTKVLLEYDCVELVKTEPRRGAVEHFYRTNPDAALGSRQWQEVPSSLQGDAIAAALDDFISCAVEALTNGTFQSRKGSLLSTFSLVLDEAGWSEVLEILDDAGNRAVKIVQKSANRMKDPDKGIPFLLALAAFEAGGSKCGRPK